MENEEKIETDGLNFTNIQTIPIATRKHKFSLENMISLDNSISLESSDLREFATKIGQSKTNKNMNIFMLGGHVIKTGCSHLLIDLMKRGFIGHLAMNGAAAIHDFEIAMIGQTSEYVGNTIVNGSFGMVEETGRYINEAAIMGARENKGYGLSLAGKIKELNLKFKESSIIYNAFNYTIPVTVHTAIGTETIYQHPLCDGASLGKVSYEDFKIFARSVSKLKGGTIANIGSAVIMPEVFLKVLSVVRNLKYDVINFSAANFDMIKQYRPMENVVNRPTSSGGNGYFIQGMHEQTIPTLHRLLIASSTSFSVI